VTLASYPAGDLALLGSDATPPGSIDNFDGVASGPVSFTVPTQTAGQTTFSNWVVDGTIYGNLVSGDVYDLQIDGVTVATSPIVQLNGAGNSLTAYLHITPGVHTFNVVSHLIPYAGLPDPYGGGTVPMSYTGAGVVEVSIAGQNSNYITAITGYSVAVTQANSFTIVWDTVIPPVTTPQSATIAYYAVTWGIAPSGPSLGGASVVPVPGGQQLYILPSSLRQLTEYWITVTVVGSGIQATATVTATTKAQARTPPPPSSSCSPWPLAFWGDRPF
jgi:hypothetical protein